jgi:hypothetical protein
MQPQMEDEVYLLYLDDVRESGLVNMSGAALYLQEEFPELSRTQAREIRTHWMQTFSARHTKEEQCPAD